MLTLGMERGLLAGLSKISSGKKSGRLLPGKKELSILSRRAVNGNQDGALFFNTQQHLSFPRVREFSIYGAGWHNYCKSI
ncbi:MAG: hypothetical protein DRG82_03550 [Deltaproteobacteria bacterium]|nr:MAG: hypothetical protein DRG82_03550 [Deltaproteobacteria bacterium]